MLLLTFLVGWTKETETNSVFLLQAATNKVPKDIIYNCLLCEGTTLVHASS